MGLCFSKEILLEKATFLAQVSVKPLPRHQRSVAVPREVPNAAVSGVKALDAEQVHAHPEDQPTRPAEPPWPFQEATNHTEAPR